MYLIYDKQGESIYKQDESKLPVLSKGNRKGKGKVVERGKEGPVKKIKIEPSTDIPSCTAVSIYTLYYTLLTME